MCDDVNIWSPVIYFFIILKLGNKVNNCMRMETLTLIHLGHECEVLHEDIIFFTQDAPPVTERRLYKPIYMISA